MSEIFRRLRSFSLFFSREGRPLFVLRLGQMDVKGILRSVGIENVLKYTLMVCEQGLIKTAEATRQLGKPIGSIFVC